MPWRFILFIVIFAVLLVFVTFNLNENHRCDISFGFTEITDVPVFLTVFVSFVLGVFCSFAFTLRRKKEIPQPVKEAKPKKAEASSDAQGGGYNDKN